MAAGMEEELVAGESPGKSEQRKSPGAATRGGRDPRLGTHDSSPSGEEGAAG